MKSQIFFSLTLIIAIQLISPSHQSDSEEAKLQEYGRPCPKCANLSDPVCGKSTVTGELRTFFNDCLLESENCERTDLRKLLDNDWSVVEISILTFSYLFQDSSFFIKANVKK